MLGKQRHRIVIAASTPRVPAVEPGSTAAGQEHAGSMDGVSVLEQLVELR